jgi:hypothetical protein
MQCGCRKVWKWKDIEKSIANQTVYLPQIILQWPWTRKSDTELCSKRVIGIAISLQPMLGTWIIFDNDRFDLDGAVKLKLQEALVVG